MKHRFTPDEPIECGHCQKVITPGNNYIKWRDKSVCTEECLKELIFDTYEAEATLEYLEDATDKALRYGDHKDN